MNYTFLPFQKEHYNIISPYFELRQTECCESDFLYHVIWKDYYDTQFCSLPNGLLWLQSIGRHKHAALLPLSKKENLKENFDLLQDYFTTVLKTKLSLFLVDEEALAILSPDPSKYRVKEDINSFDYIYDAEKLRTLSGRKYHSKKNHVNAFLREYGNKFEYRTLTEKNAQEILNFSEQWVNTKDDDEYHRLEHEIIGLKNILESYPLLAIQMGGIYVDNQLEAFSVGTYQSDLKMAVIHIEKANSQIRGLYPFMNQQFLLQEFPEAVLVNREEDMGLPTLRKAKEAYHPIKLAKKYTIYEK